MILHGWQSWGPRTPAPAWLTDLEPATTGMLSHDSLKLFTYGSQAALGFRAGGPAYPVFPGEWDPALAPGARSLLDRLADQWCLMGPGLWVARAEALVPPSRLLRRVEYDFLVRPRAGCPVPPGSGDLRAAAEADAELLFPLQEAYEKEEVLFDPAEFSALGTRLHLWSTLRHQENVVNLEGGRPVAKAGTNALTPAWGQVGGVFTRPDLRGQGRQKRLMAFLLNRLDARGRGACLFVKKANTAARNLYLGLGFEAAGDFTITYGERRSRFPFGT